MPEKRRVLDVWIVQTNTVYREVPFTVITDWVQQGRLLAEDKVRPAGTEKWHLLGKVPAVAAYLPRAEPFRVEDQAEALEPVEVDLPLHKAHAGEQDEDVDMIPLIDISLVLLIFFMMTAAVSSGVLSPIPTPEAKFKVDVITEGSYWVGIDVKDGEGKVEKGKDGRPVPFYLFGKDSAQLKEAARDPAQVLQGLQQELDKLDGEVRVRIRADHSLPVEVVRQMTVDLQALEARINNQRGAGRAKLKIDIAGEVSEPQSH